ncbi:MAG: class II aldolase/adducin family protein [Desulforhopalus sp.]|nr:class II aldolase/adducin family protein [Desulforhopalus sp.]
MERYKGVKFNYKQVAKSFTTAQEPLLQLNRWAYLFSQLGLTPVHSEGAYGNHSYRTGSSSFIITKSGMVPTEDVDEDSFAHIIAFENSANCFLFEGPSIPSSETLLHGLIYTSSPYITAILHGHCSLFLKYATALDLPITRTFHPYGTRELAESALDIINTSTRFFILRDHGFVALGESMEEAGNLTLDILTKLLQLIQKR